MDNKKLNLICKWGTIISAFVFVLSIPLSVYFYNKENIIETDIFDDIDDDEEEIQTIEEEIEDLEEDEEDQEVQYFMEEEPVEDAENEEDNIGDEVGETVGCLSIDEYERRGGDNVIVVPDLVEEETATNGN